MQSKSLAFALVAVACVAAAGGGAYLATWQHERSSAPTTAPAVAKAPQPVAVNEPQATTAEPQQTAAEPDGNSLSDGVSSSVPEAPEQPASAAEKPLVKSKPRPRPPVAPAKSRPAAGSAVTASAVETTPQPPVAPAPLPMTSPATDSGAQGQRPWLGPPATPAPLTLDATAELARTDASLAYGDQDKQWEEVVVPAESVLGLQLESSISSEFARVEDRVDAHVTRDVRIGGRVAIPAGTHAVGSVVMVDRGGRVKDRAKIGIRFDTLILPDTTRLTINTEMVYREGPSPAGQSSAKIGGAAIGGAIIGAILGGGRGAAIGSGIGAAGGTAAAMNGDRMPVVLPAGTTMSVRTLAPINMTIER
jgi:type IV secretory pathway VirB10-like protein